MEDCEVFTIPEPPPDPDFDSSFEKEKCEMMQMANYFAIQQIAWNTSNYVIGPMDIGSCWDLTGTTTFNRLLLQGKAAQIQFIGLKGERQTYYITQVKFPLTFQLEQSEKQRIKIVGLSKDNVYVSCQLRNSDDMAQGIIEIMNPYVQPNLTRIPIGLRKRCKTHLNILSMDLQYTRYNDTPLCFPHST